MKKVVKNYEELREQLASLAEDEYREFSKKLTPTERPILGVRIPKVRELAKLVPVDKINEFLKIEPETFEEVFLRGFLICRLPYDEMVKWFDSQVNYIGDWATCDVFCSALKPVIKKRREEFLEKEVETLLRDKREFATRVGLIILKNSYLEPDWLAMIFDRVERLRNREEYYVKMAIAWLLSDCYVKYPEIASTYLKVSRLPKWTYNKTISKICDSRRISAEMKDELRKTRK